MLYVLLCCGIYAVVQAASLCLFVCMSTCLYHINKLCGCMVCMILYGAALLKHAGLWSEAMSIVESLRAGAAPTSIPMSDALDDVATSLHKFRKYLRDEQNAIKDAGTGTGLLCCCF